MVVTERAQTEGSFPPLLPSPVFILESDTTEMLGFTVNNGIDMEDGQWKSRGPFTVAQRRDC